MRFTSALVVLVSVTSVLTAPTPQTTTTSISDMTSGAAAFGPAVLAGDSKAASDALAKMLGGVVSFTPNFFSDLGKAAVSAQGAAPAKGPAVAN